MAKLKTNKSILSRLKISGRGKITRRATNQSHFNTKATGQQRRSKRQESLIASRDIKAVKQFLPYNK
ncbi:MAG: 50S ribosomal protein L35 [Candidatus Azambacteria bacterium]|nr:50S ribosomal protein L35 [Candidatus Azambacteria bacterium]